MPRRYANVTANVLARQSSMDRDAIETLDRGSPSPAMPTYASDSARFLRVWLAAPLRVGAQLPSGEELSRTMAAAVDPTIPGFIVELGPGTGAVTKALLERGIRPERLILVEADPYFWDLVRARYPAVHLVTGDAYLAPRMLRQLDAGPIAAVVSGRPLLTQKPMRRQRLLLECLRLGVPGIPFVQSTYFYRSPIPIGSGMIAAEVSPMIWRNLWPARVWTYRLAGARPVVAAMWHRSPHTAEGVRSHPQPLGAHHG
jgi:phosphatidylethanolamine/phosphatidyl-N-methylethanolamine N-methyltransferase